MTIMTTTFIPCGAKLPIIGLIAGALFDNAGWVATSAYFIGMAAIIISGIMLKKTKMFSGEPAPFVMELPAYHLPTVGNVLRSMWERGWSFIKKAGTIILLSTVVLWFLQSFGVENGSFGMVDELDNSVLAAVGGVIAPLFAPLGWGDWKAAVAAVTGLIAKEMLLLHSVRCSISAAKYRKTVTRYGALFRAVLPHFRDIPSLCSIFSAHPALRLSVQLSVR